MGYEEQLAADKGARARPKEENGRPAKGQDSRPEYRPKKYEHRTKLNTPIAQIFTECQNNEFTGVRRPDPLVMKKGGRPTKKYCRYHKSKGHDTNDCMALKDDIEDRSF